MIKGLIRTANQFYDDCVRVKDSRDKRKTLYQLEDYIIQMAHQLKEMINVGK